MTKLSLFWFSCKRCNTIFLSYVEGKPIYNCECEDGLCFFDENLGDIHNNHCLNPVPKIRLCRKCRKGVDLTTYTGLPNPEVIV